MLPSLFLLGPPILSRVMTVVQVLPLSVDFQTMPPQQQHLALVIKYSGKLYYLEFLELDLDV